MSGAPHSYRTALADRLLKYSFVEAIGGMPSADWKDFQALMQQALRGSHGPNSEQDAERYRFIRSKLCNRESLEFHRFPTVLNLAGIASLNPYEIDAAVDAMQEEVRIPATGSRQQTKEK